MQESSAALESALNCHTVSWAKPQVLVDWDDEHAIASIPCSGYGDAILHTIDDVSDQVGPPLVVNQSLDDGLPNELTTSHGTGVSEASVPMMYGSSCRVIHEITARGYETDVNGAATSDTITVPLPTGVKVGDILVAAISISDPAEYLEVASHTWIELIDDDDTDVRTYVLWRHVIASDIASGDDFVFGLSGAVCYAAIITAFYADHGVLWIGDYDSSDEGAATTDHVTPSVTSTFRQSALCGIFARRGDTADWSADVLDTEIANVVGTHAVTTNVNEMMSLSDILPPGSYTRTATTTLAESNAVKAAVIIEFHSYEDMLASQYFSPYNDDSPIVDKQRDTAPMTICEGAITENGPELVRVFTGHTAGTPIDSSNRVAEIRGISKTRSLLSTLIQPPTVQGYLEGLETAWPVIYAMHKCGLYVQPPPLADCRLWYPMCGSVHPMIPYTNVIAMGSIIYKYDAVGGEWPPSTYTREFLDGPFHRAPYLYVGDVFSQGFISGMFPNDYPESLGDGDDILSQDGDRCAVEFWIRADAISGTNPSAPSKIFNFETTPDVSSAYVECYIDTSYRLRITLDDGANTFSFPVGSTLTIPQDDEWHSVGFAWNVSENALYVYLDGASAEYNPAGPAMSNLNLPAVDDIDYLGIYCYLPISDLHATAGITGDRSISPWIADIDFTPTAEVDASEVHLNALAESLPREAWEFISSLAQGELAAFFTDEHDIIRYLGQDHWYRDAWTRADGTIETPQTVVDALDTALNIGSLSLDNDNTRVRNVIAVTYSDTIVDNQIKMVVSESRTDELPPWATLVITLIPAQPLVSLPSPDITPNNCAGTEPTDESFITLNEDTDGTGAYATGVDVIASVVSWLPGEVIIAITNLTVNTYYLVNDVNWPTIGIAGYSMTSEAATVVATDDSSIALRGHRTLTIDLPQIQRDDMAFQVAQTLADHFGGETIRIDNATLFGDPRRQPGDLVSFTDAYNTNVSGNWRLVAIDHLKHLASFIQRASLTSAFMTGVVAEDTDPTYEDSYTVDGPYVVAADY